MTLTATLAETIARIARDQGPGGTETGTGGGESVTDATVEIDRLVRVLRLERRRAEAVAARLHLLRLALGPGALLSVDAADEGLCDAIDHLRQADLLRAVLMSGVGIGDDVALDELTAGVLTSVPTANALEAAADDLCAAAEAAATAGRTVLDALDDGFDSRRISSGRRAALRHLVTHAVPTALLGP